MGGGGGRQGAAPGCARLAHLCSPSLPLLCSAPIQPAAAGPTLRQTLLGAWDKNSGAGVDMASQLAQAVSANKLCRSYMAFNTNYHDTGEGVRG